ncbi:MAG: hypothetical protein V3V08_18190 [Nannocystaceae bacterium]
MHRHASALPRLAPLLLIGGMACDAPPPLRPTAPPRAPARATATSQPGVAPGQRPPEQRPSEQPPPEHHATREPLRIQFIAEMKPMPAAYADTGTGTGTNPAARLDPADIAAFRSEWKRLRPALAAQVTPERLRAISRWSAKEMRDYSLPANWIEQISMSPQSRSASGQSIRFGQPTRDGFPLPSHHDIVFRRLIVAAEYDIKTGTVTGCVVSIRGWVEE